MPHTPAPWNWNGTCLVAEPSRDYPDGYAVAKVFNATDVPLIAAARALLAALRDALACIDSIPVGDRVKLGLYSMQWYGEARAAIRAAAGEA